MSLRGAFAYSCCALFVGLLFVGLTLATQNIGAGATAGILALSGAAGLLGFARLSGRRLVWRLNWTTVVAGALVAAATLAGAMLAAARIGAALTVIVLAAIPLFGNVGAQLRGRARITGPTALGLGLGLLGLYLVAATPVGEPSWRFIAGVLYALSAAVIAGISSRWLGELVEHERAVEHAVAGLLVAAALLFCVVPFTPAPGNPWWVLAVVGLGVGCGLLLLVAMSAIAPTLPRRSAATLPGAGTVLAALGGVLLLGEHVSWVEWLGAALVILGVALLSEPLLASVLPSSWRR
jgi:DME family drug/metabolite transporter